MLYLEDYLELIEHLPSDLSERLTDMREMDLQVCNYLVIFPTVLFLCARK